MQGEIDVVGRGDAGGTTGLRPSRRAFVRSAVWTVPAVAAVAAAPAFAASTCAPTTIDFTNYPTNQQVPSGTSTNVNGVIVTLNYTGDTTAPNNATIFQTTTSTKELRFYDPNTTTNTATSQSITLSFNQQVKNLTVTLVDIDYAANSYDDRVVVGTAGYSATVGSNILGNGSAAAPYRSTSQAADGATTNNVALTWVSATSVTFNYNQPAMRVSGSPHIGIRTITFTPTSC